ncbi:MAG: translation initiation factor [Victivallales bacterium]|nr:translation initiation factor [Victivallales bacterium]
MKKKPTPPATGSSTPWNNPFAGLKLDLPKTQEPPPPPPPSPEEQRKAALSPEDQKLLEAFGGATLSVGTDKPAEPAGPRLSFNIQRKGKGGKTVTLVYGLKELELTEQMTLGAQLQKALGTGARFEDGVLQIQGDQRERAAAWFAKHGFKC